MSTIEIIKIISLIVGSYFFGNINMALIISKLKKQDVRDIGSGNPGTMNMLRNFGIKLGAVTLSLDILKGVVPCLVGWFIVGDLGFNDFRLGIHIAGLAVIVGHIFPVFLGFKGGKGIASSIGVCFVAQPIVTLITLALGIAFIFITKMGSITSFLIISIPLGLEGLRMSQSHYDGALASCILVFALFSLTLFAHRSNVKKLFIGTERATVLVGKNKSANQAKEIVNRK